MKDAGINAIGLVAAALIMSLWFGMMLEAFGWQP